MAASATIQPLNQGTPMTTTIATTCVLFSTLLGPVAIVVAQDSDTDRSHPVAFVKDSAITLEIKAKLGGEHSANWGRIHVNTDKNGVVWLTGSARTQEAAEKAESIARETEGVKVVHSRIKIKKDDSTDATHLAALQGQPPQPRAPGVEEKRGTLNGQLPAAAGLLLALGLLSGAGVAPPR
jgi:hyperosmotically inducible periplasmic protein